MTFPPLVTHGTPLPAREQLRTARQSRLPAIGTAGQERLFAARVAVVGAGGLGSPTLLYLASAGVGTIAIIDDDTVDLSNLQRQVIFGVDDVGRSKTTVARERIHALAPDATVIEVRQRLIPDNARELLSGYHLVIDGSDTFATRHAVADACDALGIPLVWGSVLQFDGQVSVCWSRPPHGPGVRMRDVFPDTPPPGSVPTCAEAGVLGPLCGQVGAILAAETIKLVTGAGRSLFGRMLVIDALSARTREVPLLPTDTAPSTRGLPATESSGPPATESVTTVLPTALASLGPVTLIDVREPDEVAAGTIDGAHAVPLGSVLASPATVELGDVTVVFCQRGPRARTAIAALAAAHPAADLRLLAGGYAAWQSADSER